MRHRGGKKKAIIAVAHQLLKAYYVLARDAVQREDLIVTTTTDTTLSASPAAPYKPSSTKAIGSPSNRSLKAAGHFLRKSRTSPQDDFQLLERVLGEPLTSLEITPCGEKHFVDARVFRLHIATASGRRRTLICKRALTRSSITESGDQISFYREKLAYRPLTNVCAPVPRLLLAAEAFLLLEDLGEVTLADRYVRSKEHIVLESFVERIGALHSLFARRSQVIPSRTQTPQTKNQQAADEALEATGHYCRQLMLPVPVSVQYRLLKTIDWASEIVSGTRRYLIHGDLHPRNSLILNEQVYFVDWEHIRLGLLQEDLCCFLTNWELNLDRRSVYDLLEHYFDTCYAWLGQETWPSFRRTFLAADVLGSVRAFSYWTIRESVWDRANYYFQHLNALSEEILATYGKSSKSFEITSNF